MSRIAVVSESMVMGGTEVAIVSLINKLVEKGHEVTLFLVGNHGELKERIASNIDVREIQFKSDIYKEIADTSVKIKRKNVIKRVIRKIIGWVIKLKKESINDFLTEKCLCEKEKYDVVFDAFGYGRFTTAFAAKCIEAPQKALWFHDENLHWVSKCKDYFGFFDHFFCVSNAVKTALIQQSPEIIDRVSVLHNFIDPKQIAKKSMEEINLEFKEDFNILTIGRLEDQKGIDIAIKTAGLLKQRNYCFRWYVIGKGSLFDQLNEQIISSGVDDCFCLLGVKNNPYPYLKKCDLYVQPSRHEGYPITLIEARVLNCPIVASDIESISEQIYDGKNGYLLPLEPEKFANKIAELIDNADERYNLKKRLQNEVIDFSEDYMILTNQFGI